MVSSMRNKLSQFLVYEAPEIVGEIRQDHRSVRR